MQADASQQTVLLGQFTGVVERRHVGHQGRRADHLSLEGAQGQLVVVQVETEVVGIDDDPVGPGGSQGAVHGRDPCTVLAWRRSRQALRRGLSHCQMRSAVPASSARGRQE